MGSETPFDPARYLTRVNGNEYLEVKWRLVWLRDRHPDTTLETEMVKIGGEGQHGFAIFKATITLPTGGSATGFGSESAGDFRDFIEKAETKAIGRALAALGFGTQFAPDHEFGAAQGRVVDSPVKGRGSAPQRTARGSNTPPVASANGDEGESPVSTAPNEAATQRQLRYLQAVARESGIDGAGLDERSMSEFGVQAAALSRRDASSLIDLIQQEAQAATLQS